MRDSLKTRAHELGLAAVGIAPAIDEVRASYTWARSVVCAAISYLPPQFDTVAGAGSLSAGEANDYPPRGLVARIARGADYHTVLRAKLVHLADSITSAHPSARVEVCVDTCDLPERKLAVLSGIGWQGKNGNVFIEGCGSWAALGEIVTDLPLESESVRLNDRCGDCTRCIDACPTKAIVASYEVDCSRCLSALTQCSGSIDIALRPALGNRIYGCDICQEVCPQNLGIVPVTPEFATESFPGARPELLPLVRLSAERFRQLVAPSSIGWIRRSRIRRNAIVAVGNLKCEAALPVLTELLSEESPTLREAAEWAIKEIGIATEKE